MCVHSGKEVADALPAIKISVSTAQGRDEGEEPSRVAEGVPCDRQIDNLLTTYKIGKRRKVLCMANLPRHKAPSLGVVPVTNVSFWVRLR